MIFIILLIIVFFIIYCNVNFEGFKSSSKIAIYTGNFGNYRNETKNINKIKKIPNIDYYYFTDNTKNLKSDIWNIHHYPLYKNPLYGNMDKYRYTAKYCKFNMPDILNKYDYVLYLDLKNSTIKIHNNYINLESILNLITNNPDTTVFFRQHDFYPSDVTSVYDEIERVIRWNKEQSDTALLWHAKLKKQKWEQSDIFIDSDLILRKTNNINLNNILSSIPKELVNNKLTRDQLMIPYILQKNKHNLNYKIINKQFSYFYI